MIAELIAGIIRGLGGVLEQHLRGESDADEAVQLARLELGRLDDWIEEQEAFERQVVVDGLPDDDN